MSGHSQKAKGFESAYVHVDFHCVSRTRMEKAVPSRFASPQFANVGASGAARRTQRVMLGIALMPK